MIFVTVGSQKFPFDRLIKKADEMVKNRLMEDVYIQTGTSVIVPSCPHRAFCSQEHFEKLMDACDILITHAGAGTMVNAVKRGKRVIAVPRLARYNEHVDDHQEELAAKFHEMNLLYACMDIERLPEALDEVKTRSFNRLCSNTEVFLASLDSCLHKLQ